MENDTTKCLEARARARGLSFLIRQLGTKYKPCYCITRRDNVDLSPPMQIGASIMEAEIWLDKNQVHPAKQGRLSSAVR